MLHEQIDTDPADGTSVEIYTYAGCAEELRWYKVVGGGHTWFGTDVGRIAQRIVGKPGKEIDAVDEIVAFFKNHGL